MRTKLRENERILIKTGLHWMTLLKPAIWILVITYFMYKLVYDPTSEESGTGEGLFIMYIPIAFTILVVKFLKWRNTLWVVTNYRIIDEFGLFSSNSKESPLDKINNVDYSQSFTGRYLNYGNVKVQTAATNGKTESFKFANPEALKDTISLAQEEYKQAQINGQANAFGSIINNNNNNQNDMVYKIEKLYELKLKGILTEEEFTKKKSDLLGEPQL